MFLREFGNAPSVVPHAAHSSFGDAQTSANDFQNLRQSGPQAQTLNSHTSHQNYQRAGKQKVGLAFTSMVLGVTGCFFIAPVSLILGISALVKANKRSKEYGGKVFAAAGVVLNSLGFCCCFSQ